MEQRAHRSQDHHTRHQRQEAQTLRHCGGGGAQATQLVMSYVAMFSNYVILYRWKTSKLSNIVKVFYKISSSILIFCTSHNIYSKLTLSIMMSSKNLNNKNTITFLFFSSACIMYQCIIFVINYAMFIIKTNNAKHSTLLTTHSKHFVLNISSFL